MLSPLNREYNRKNRFITFQKLAIHYVPGHFSIEPISTREVNAAFEIKARHSCRLIQRRGLFAEILYRQIYPQLPHSRSYYYVRFTDSPDSENLTHTDLQYTLTRGKKARARASAISDTNDIDKSRRRFATCIHILLCQIPRGR